MLLRTQVSPVSDESLTLGLASRLMYPVDLMYMVRMSFGAIPGSGSMLFRGGTQAVFHGFVALEGQTVELIVDDDSG